MNNAEFFPSCDACDASCDAYCDAAKPAPVRVVTHVTLLTHTHIRARTRTHSYFFHVTYVTCVSLIKTALILKGFFCDASCDASGAIRHNGKQGVLC